MLVYLRRAKFGTPLSDIDLQLLERLYEKRLGRLPIFEQLCQIFESRLYDELVQKLDAPVKKASQAAVLVEPRLQRAVLLLAQRLQLMGRNGQAVGGQ